MNQISKSLLLMKLLPGKLLIFMLCLKNDVIATGDHITYTRVCWMTSGLNLFKTEKMDTLRNVTLPCQKQGGKTPEILASHTFFPYPLYLGKLHTLNIMSILFSKEIYLAFIFCELSTPTFSCLMDSFTCV